MSNTSVLSEVPSRYERHLAKIERAFLGIDDHGPLAVSLDFIYEGGGTGQGTGLYTTDFMHHRHQERIYEATGLIFIRRTLETLGLTNWDEVGGQVVHVLKQPGKDPIVGFESLSFDREPRRFLFREMREYAEKYPTPE